MIENYKPDYEIMANRRGLSYYTEIYLDFDNKVADVEIEDDYYSFDLPFDTILDMAKKIKEMPKEFHQEHLKRMGVTIVKGKENKDE